MMDDAHARLQECLDSVIVFAQEEARALNQNAVGTEMLLLGLMRQEREAESLLRALGATLKRGREEVERIVGKSSAASTEVIPLSQQAQQVVERARLVRGEIKAQGADSLVVLLAVVEAVGVARRALQQMGVSVAKLHVLTLMKLGLTQDEAVKHAQDRLQEALKAEVARTSKVLEERLLKDVPLADESLQRTQAEFKSALKFMGADLREEAAATEHPESDSETASDDKS